MATYKTAEVAAMIGVHPNTVRLYEKMKVDTQTGTAVKWLSRIYRFSYMAMQINTAGVSSRSIAKWFEKENCTNGYGVCCG